MPAPSLLPGTTDRRIDALLTLLAENATIVISGAKIAKEIGVSRQQVFRWIEKLRALGVRVKGHPRTGYHIERVPDILAPQMLRKAAPALVSRENWWTLLPAALAIAVYMASLRAASAVFTSRRERLLAVVEGRA